MARLPVVLMVGVGVGILSVLFKDDLPEISGVGGSAKTAEDVRQVAYTWVDDSGVSHFSEVVPEVDGAKVRVTMIDASRITPVPKPDWDSVPEVSAIKAAASAVVDGEGALPRSSLPGLRQQALEMRQKIEQARGLQ